MIKTIRDVIGVTFLVIAAAPFALAAVFLTQEAKYNMTSHVAEWLKSYGRGNRE